MSDGLPYPGTGVDARPSARLSTPGWAWWLAAALCVVIAVKIISVLPASTDGPFPNSVLRVRFADLQSVKRCEGRTISALTDLRTPSEAAARLRCSRDCSPRIAAA